MTRKAIKKKRKHDNGQEKEERKQALDQENCIQEKTKTIKKKEGRNWKTKIRRKYLFSFFRYIQFGRIWTNDRNYF